VIFLPELKIKNEKEKRSRINIMTHSTLVPNEAYAGLATDEQVARTAQALEANNIHTIVVDNGDQAKAELWKLIPHIGYPGRNTGSGTALRFRARQIGQDEPRNPEP
jgi:hypothetical protein